MIYIYIYNFYEMLRIQRNIIYLIGHAYKIIVKVKLCTKNVKDTKIKD